MANTKAISEKTSRKEGIDYCGHCGDEAENEAVECEVCEKWFHIKCAGIASGAYKALKADKAIHWYCKGCSGGVVNTWKKLHERQEKMEKEMAELREEVNGMKTFRGRIENLESSMENHNKEWKELQKRIKQVEEKEVREDQQHEVENMKLNFQEIVREQELEREKELKNKDKEIQQKMFEVMEREKRKKNLIIRGIKEEGEINERDEVKKILETLIVDNIKYDIIGRVGKKGTEGSKGRPLRIQVEDVDQKWRILSRGKKLKDAGEEWLRKVYLAPDLTKVQQEEDKKLRDKVKEFRDTGKLNVRITKGQVVSRENGSSEVLYTLEK
jgi:hypothetical protein